MFADLEIEGLQRRRVSIPLHRPLSWLFTYECRRTVFKLRSDGSCWMGDVQGLYNLEPSCPAVFESQGCLLSMSTNCARLDQIFVLFDKSLRMIWLFPIGAASGTCGCIARQQCSHFDAGKEKSQFDSPRDGKSSSSSFQTSSKLYFIQTAARAVVLLIYELNVKTSTSRGNESRNKIIGLPNYGLK